MVDTNSKKAVLAPSLSARLIFISNKIKKKREKFLSEIGLMPGHDDLLLAIGKSDGITMGTLSKQLGISASSTTKIATKLENHGLLRREASRLDSRQNHAFLTKSGQELTAKIAETYHELDLAFVGKLKSKELEKAFKLLDRLESQKEKGNKKPKKAVNKHLKTDSKKVKKSKSK